MTLVRVKGFKIYKDRHGKPRCYHRATRLAVDLATAPIGSAAFFAECERIVASHAVVKPKAGTLAQLVAEYRAHVAFLDLAPQTRGDYQKVLDYLKPLDGTPLASFHKALVVRIRDKAAEAKGRRFGNYVKALLSILFGWGSERGYLKTNPAAGIKDIRRKKGAPEANRPWSDAERHAALEAVPAHMRLPLALMMLTGLGPKDTLTLPRNIYRYG